LRYALSLPNGGVCGDPRVLAEMAQTAEAAGWDAVLLEDYIQYQGKDVPTCDPWIALTAIAVRTQRLRIGTAVTPVPRRRPWYLAQQVATLDRLSGGRVILGVGAGDPRDPTYRALSEETDIRKRAAMLDEGLIIIDRLWSGNAVDFTGQHYRVDGLRLSLTPLQRPRVPIWVGGLWPRRTTIERAARWDGALLGFKVGPGNGEVDMTPADVELLVQDIARRRPVDSYDIVMGGRARESNESAERQWIREMAGAGATWWCEWVPPGQEGEMRQAAQRGPLRI
jgi:alkanesulfonate monooxygenase SsuD/methylene tetrahydromethanopterin reductase-like flavin-dependent oxidoreductase (luciferase family)